MKNNDGHRQNEPGETAGGVLAVGAVFYIRSVRIFD